MFTLAMAYSILQTAAIQKNGFMSSLPGLTAKEVMQIKVTAGSKDQLFCGKKIHFRYNRQQQPICAPHPSDIEVRKDPASTLARKIYKTKTSHTGSGML